MAQIGMSIGDMRLVYLGIAICFPFWLLVFPVIVMVVLALPLALLMRGLNLIIGIQSLIDRRNG